MVDPLVRFHFADEFVMHVRINPKEIYFLFRVLVRLDLPYLVHTFHPSSPWAMALINGYSVLDTSILRRCYFLMALGRFWSRIRLGYELHYG